MMQERRRRRRRRRIMKLALPLLMSAAGGALPRIASSFITPPSSPSFSVKNMHHQRTNSLGFTPRRHQLPHGSMRLEASRRPRGNISRAGYNRRQQQEKNHQDSFIDESFNNNNDPFGDFDDDDDDWYNNDVDDDEEEDSRGRGGNKDTTPYDVTNDEELSSAASSRLTSSSTKESSSSKQKSHFFSQKSLDDASFRLHDDDDGKNDHHGQHVFDDLCQGAGITRPSKIQSLAWPILLSGKSAILADQTGSGKTLAYLIPLIQRAISLNDNGPRKRPPGTPRIVVLAPTAELADQTRAVCDQLSQFVEPALSTMVITATGKYSTMIRDQIRRLQRTPIDILISTPGRLSTILRSKNAGGLDLSQLQALVLDEVDVLLMDDTFGPQLRTVGAAAPVDEMQFVFCTATLPNDIVATVQREFPNTIQIRGPGLHRVAPTVQQRLVDVSVPPQYNRNAQHCFNVKAQELKKALRETKCRRTLIFCNTVESCRQVENLLQRQDRKGQIYKVQSYHNAMTPEARNRNLRIFAKGLDDNDERSSGRGGGGGGGSSSRRNKAANAVDYILVCTDRAARGVDFEAAPVDHVVLFDFPKDPAEYVRRVGRVARAGRQGTSTVLAYGWQLPIARSVMDKTLDSLSSITTTTSVDDDDDDEAEEFGARRRRRQKKKIGNSKNAMIKGNIEGGRLWSDRN